jgi:lipid-A-disaccharide synthase-like uncharacterized protein
MTNALWLGVGFLGQGMFAARFIVQWLASERQKKSVVPTSFWFLSIGAGVTLLAYAIHRRDPVFIAGQITGVLIYGRNLWFIFRERRPAEIEPSGHRRREGGEDL